MGRIEELETNSFDAANVISLLLKESPRKGSPGRSLPIIIIFTVAGEERWLKRGNRSVQKVFCYVRRVNPSDGSAANVMEDVEFVSSDRRSEAHVKRLGEWVASEVHHDFLLLFYRFLNIAYPLSGVSD